MIASILKENYNVGLYTSPHLIDIRERIQINNKKISKREFVEIFNECKNLIEKFNLTFFEALTLMAFVYFEKKGIEIGVIEVGMGGRYDATNVINPMLSIITNISIDHQEFLGKDEISIAKEKAGIIKEKVPLITCVSQDEILNLYREICRQKNSELILINFFPKGIYKDLRYQEFVHKSKRYTIPLLGEHQVKNAVCAIEAAEKLKKTGIKISDNAIKKGLSNVKIEGRFEVVKRNPLIIVDVAHNKASFEALFNTILEIKNIGNFKHIILILGILKYKNLEEIFKVVSGFLGLISTIILTKPNYELAAEPEDMKKFLNFENVFLKDNVKNAIELALEINELNIKKQRKKGRNENKGRKEEKNCIVIAGSFFTASEAKKIIKLKNLI